MKSSRTWISIHAPREGGDLKPPVLTATTEGFQSTPPARGATGIVAGMPKCFKISIHAPREGGDCTNGV
mgnify:CR=1 FL=1